MSSEKTRLIIKKVAELFSYGNSKKTTEEVAQENYERLLSKEDLWETAFRDYEVDDVIAAVNQFWVYKTDKGRPSVSQIKAILDVSVKASPNNKSSSTHSIKNFNISSMLMERDKATNKNEIYNLYDYKKCVNYILNIRLKDKLSEEDWKNLKDEDEALELGNKYRKALDLNLFYDLDVLLGKAHERLL